MNIHDLIKIMETFPCLHPYIKSRLTGPHVESLDLWDLNDWAIEKFNHQTFHAARLMINLWNTEMAIRNSFHFNLMYALESFDEKHKAAFLNLITKLTQPQS